MQIVVGISERTVGTSSLGFSSGFSFSRMLPDVPNKQGRQSFINEEPRTVGHAGTGRAAETG